MTFKVKNHLKKHPKVYKVLQLINFVLRSKWFPKSFKKNRYPEILQFPITNRCNAKCVMCNVHQLSSKKEMNLEEFKKVINDDVFKDIRTVGINGGEPFLKPDLIMFIEEILKMEKIESLNIISNGFLTNFILTQIEAIYLKCKEKNVHFHISISLDGYGQIHDKVRGVNQSFEKTLMTIQEIAKNSTKYCDTYDIGCTIVKQNVDYLVELDSFAARKGFKIKYRLGIENNRLNNQELKDKYSVIDDPHFKQSSAEFLFSMIFKAETIYEKFKYYSLFSFLSHSSKRKLGCDWKEKGITLDGEGNIYYCAVKSPCLANLKERRGKEVLFSSKAVKEKKKIMDLYCENCIHDYYGTPDLKNVLRFLKFIYQNKMWIKKYRR
ncbi:radical SAM protein [Anaerosinus gibii]|uniref:Radical SAM protein n=1 Tax=Selenobaculum gibii TaxID=3054208 RepID=A0A9Y2EU41_9FIRM|nr:radical SAM protein [Selenobaculum gbiensis]WIW71090.1 radical SAM protein [Selenobaculum gbiensis]